MFTMNVLQMFVMNTKPSFRKPHECLHLDVATMHLSKFFLGLLPNSHPVYFNT